MSNSDEEDDELGPSLLSQSSKRPRRHMDNQLLTLLASLPTAKRYERSWMHRTPVTHIEYLTKTNFLVTASAEDGVVKFWKHVGGQQLLEFVKQFAAHAKPLSSLSGSGDGEQVCTVSAEEHTVRFFLVRTFDMAAFVSTGENFFPHVAQWTSSSSLVCVACRDTPKVRVYNAQTCEVQRELSGLSLRHATVCMAPAGPFGAGVMVSADASGVISYWTVEEKEGDDSRIGAEFEHKMDTDLFALARRKLAPVRIQSTFTKGTRGKFVVTTADGAFHVFDYASGKMLPLPLPPCDEEDDDAPSVAATKTSLVSFDQSGRLLLVGTPGVGVRVLALDTMRVVSSTLASGEQEDCSFLDYSSTSARPLALFQGVLANTDYQLERNTSTAMSSSSSSSAQQQQQQQHPLFICSSGPGSTAHRFLVFTQREPEGGGVDARDVLNEKPTEQQIQRELHLQRLKKAQGLSRRATLHTSLGDIQLELFPVECPRTVENFIGHAQDSKRHTYVGVPFHRVIRGFMIQTGDPEGDGTGGESIWGGTFEDEFSPELRFNQPFLVCMANRGPNTNGSQFFITVPGGGGCAHLEGKHTIFGRVVGESSQEVVKRIELVKVDSKDRPVKEVKIVSVSVV